MDGDAGHKFSAEPRKMKSGRRHVPGGKLGDPRPDQNLTAGLFCRSIDLKY